MKITKIKKMNNGKYKVSFDSLDDVVTYDEVILKNNLLTKRELDESLINNINIETNYYDIYNKVLKYISIRQRSEKEINKYLEKYNDTSLTKKIIDNLKETKLINKDLYLKSYIYDRLNLSNDGPYKIVRELMRHDYNEEEIVEEIKKHEPLICEKLNKLMIKKINLNHTDSRYKLKNKLSIYFNNLGFDNMMVNESFELNYKGNNDLIIKEYEKLLKKLKNKYENNELEYKIIEKLYQKGFTKEEISKIKSE